MNRGRREILKSVATALFVLLMIVAGGCGKPGREAQDLKASAAKWGSFKIPPLQQDLTLPGTHGLNPNPAGGWTQFRGDAFRSGITDLPVNPAEISLAWKFALSDHTFSYTQGMRVWSANAILTPALDNFPQRVLAGAYDRKLYCLDAATGQVIWKFTTGADISASPALALTEDGPLVILASRDRTLYALNLKDGSLKWSWEAMKWSYTAGPCEFSSPLIFNWRNQQFIALALHIHDTTPVTGQQSGQLLLIRARDGKVIWLRETGTTPPGEPALGIPDEMAEPLLFLPDTNGTLGAVSAMSGQPLWRFTADYFIHSPAVWDSLSKEVIFGTRFGVVSFLDGATGSGILTFRAGHYVDSAPLMLSNVARTMKGAAVFGCYDRSLYCISRDNGSLLWKIPTGNQIFSSPAQVLAAGGQAILFSSSDDHLYLAGAEKGSILWKFRHGSLIWPYVRRGDTQFSSPSAGRLGTDTMILMPAYDGVLYAFISKTGL